MLPRAPGAAGIDVDAVGDAGPVGEAGLDSAAGLDEGRPEALAEVREAPVAPGDVEPGDPADGARPALSERDLAVLALEGRRYRNQGAKEQAVRDELGLSATRYYQVLNALLDDERALAHDPVLVGRLRRLRRARASGPAR